MNAMQKIGCLKGEQLVWVFTSGARIAFRVVNACLCRIGVHLLYLRLSRNPQARRTDISLRSRGLGVAQYDSL